MRNICNHKNESGKPTLEYDDIYEMRGRHMHCSRCGTEGSREELTSTPFVAHMFWEGVGCESVAAEERVAAHCEGDYMVLEGDFVVEPPKVGNTYHITILREGWDKISLTNCEVVYVREGKVAVDVGRHEHRTVVYAASLGTYYTNDRGEKLYGAAEAAEYLASSKHTTTNCPIVAGLLVMMKIAEDIRAAIVPHVFLQGIFCGNTAMAPLFDMRQEGDLVVLEGEFIGKKPKIGNIYNISVVQEKGYKTALACCTVEEVLDNFIVVKVGRRDLNLASYVADLGPYYVNDRGEKLNKVEDAVDYLVGRKRVATNCPTLEGMLILAELDRETMEKIHSS